MTELILPESSTSSRFGWPKPLRIETFSKLMVAGPKATTRIVFQGQNTDIPIIRVPIGLPKYRLENGRTISLQSEHMATKPTVRRDLFTGDPEMWDAQEEQHRLLLKLSRQSDLEKYFEDPAKGQVDAILLDEEGYVVNGNRRLSTWRELLHKDPKKYAGFAHIDVAVLPHCSAREIDRLEASLQIEKDIRADYNWDAHANMMLSKQKKDSLSVAELAEIYKMKEPKVEELLDMLAYADEYLTSRGKEDHWSIVSGQEFGFRRIVEGRQKLTGVGNQEVFKQAAFVLIDDPDEAGGRLYDAIPAIAESLEIVKERLRHSFKPAEVPTDEGLDALFGGGSVAAPTVSGLASNDVALAGEIQKPDNSAKARAIIVEVIESQKQLRKDSKAAGFLLQSCAKANALLAAVTRAGLRPDWTRAGVPNQLDEIEKQVALIREFLAKHATD